MFFTHNNCRFTDYLWIWLIFLFYCYKHNFIFINQLFSKKASAPTKLGEFLGCGIPCLTNNKIGDMQLIIESENVGISIPDFSQNSIRKGMQDLIDVTQIPNISQKCVQTSSKYFSLNNGVQRYDEIYTSL